MLFLVYHGFQNTTTNFFPDFFYSTDIFFTNIKNFIQYGYTPFIMQKIKGGGYDHGRKKAKAYSFEKAGR